jgi:hypothetical protein
MQLQLIHKFVNEDSTAAQHTSCDSQRDVHQVSGIMRNARVQHCCRRRFCFPSMDRQPWIAIQPTRGLARQHAYSQPVRAAAHVPVHWQCVVQSDLVKIAREKAFLRVPASATRLEPHAVHTN